MKSFPKKYKTVKMATHIPDHFEFINTFIE